MKKLPVGATSLDFAYNIHSEIGNHSIGAKVNLALVPLNHVLTNGDQVEIITSKIQKPQKEWLEYVVTGRAKNYVKEAIKTEKKEFYDAGKEKLRQLFGEIGMEFTKQNARKFREFNGLNSSTDLYFEVAQNNIGLPELKSCCQKSEKSGWLNINSYMPFAKQKNIARKSLEQAISEKIRNKPEEVLLGEKIDIDYKFAMCCNPIPGDDVIGLIMPNNPIMVHRANCKNAVDLMSSFGNRIVKAKWNEKDPVSFLAGIEFSGIDKIGLIYQLTKVISQVHNIKIRSFQLDSSNEISRGKIMLYVQDTQKLNNLLVDLKKIKEIKKISRMNPASPE
jgi:GTP pyrophosphokinase